MRSSDIVNSSELPTMRQPRHADLARRADDAELQALLVIVVHPVLGIDDPDVDVERAGQQLELADRESHDSLGLHRNGDAVDERVRAEHADPVLAVEIHAEHRVAHALWIAVTDLDRGRLRRLEDNAVLPIGTEDPRARAQIVRDEHDRLLRRAELPDLREALVLEVLVPDGEHLVHQENVRLEMHGDGETEAHVHAARVGLHRRVKEAPDVGELLDRGHRAVHLLARKAEERAVEVRVLAAAEVGMESGADLEERGHATVDLERSTGRLRRAREELEQRRLPRSIRADHTERGPRLHREADVAERLHHLGWCVLPQDRLFERAAPLAAELVRLRDVVRADRAHLWAMAAEISAPKRSSFSRRMFAASFGSATSSARLDPAARSTRTSGFANPASSTISA